VSSGSSCSASALEPSHVLAAMGLLSSGSLRVSLHRGTTAADVDRLLEVLPRVAAEQRGD
jgi:cysteine desulfurase